VFTFAALDPTATDPTRSQTNAYYVKGWARERSTSARSHQGGQSNEATGTCKMLAAHSAYEMGETSTSWGGRNIS
jgi:hypothetical protein